MLRKLQDEIILELDAWFENYKKENHTYPRTSDRKLQFRKSLNLLRDEIIKMLEDWKHLEDEAFDQSKYEMNKTYHKGKMDLFDDIIDKLKS